MKRSAPLLALLSAIACIGAPQVAPNNKLSNGMVAEVRRVDSRAAEQLLNAYNAGDSYPNPQGQRTLFRLAGAISVRVNGQTTVEALTAPTGVLAGYERVSESKSGFALLKAGTTERDAQRKNSSALTAKVSAARKVVGVLTANPVFIEPSSGLWAMTTDEIVVALKPGVDAQTYFGADWAKVKPLFAPLGQYILTLTSTESEAIFAEVSRRAADPRVAWAEPNFVTQGLTQLVPNDPQLTSQWYLRNTGQSGGTSGADVKATAAWDRTTGSSSIIVAVLDVGFDLAHPDLIANLATNALEIPGNGIDDDANGYVDDVRGWNFWNNNNNPNPQTPNDNHGTPVAGAAVAAGNNGVGIAGMAFGSRLLPLRIGESSDPSGSFSATEASLVNAIYYAAGGLNQSDSWRGADVIVMSFETVQSLAFDSALTYATEQGRSGRGCPTFVAMGNHGDGWQTVNLNGVSAGTHRIEWKYSKNASLTGGEDAVWLGEVIMPGVGTQRFDGAAFPPPGWGTSGNAGWTRSSDPSHAYGPSAFAARSGVIGNSQSSSLITTQNFSAGTLVYTHWVSSEQDVDIFSLTYDGTLIAGANDSGVPFIRSGPSYPASHTNVISIGASTHSDTRATYSQFGGKIDFVAPGGGGGGAQFFTTDRTGTNGGNSAASPAGDYESSQGTSLANPLAAGVAALVLSVTPGLSALQVRDILRTTADKVGPVPYTNGWNSYYGAGRVNASNAVAAATSANCLGVPFIVTTLADSGNGTLRDAIQRINASGCSGTISLNVTGVINLASSLPALTRGATVTGPGTNQLIINGAGTSSMFSFAAGTTNRVSRVRLANAFSSNPGASIANAGYTVIENCSFTNSVASQSMGGAIANTSAGVAFVTNCVFVSNKVLGGAGEDRGPGPERWPRWRRRGPGWRHLFRRTSVDGERMRLHCQYRHGRPRRYRRRQ